MKSQATRLKMFIKTEMQITIHKYRSQKITGYFLLAIGTYYVLNFLQTKQK